jgi:hypothetical protein
MDLVTAAKRFISQTPGDTAHQEIRIDGHISSNVYCCKSTISYLILLHNQKFPVMSMALA